MSHVVTETTVEARPTAVVAAATSWDDFPTLWPKLSGEVWGCLRAAGIDRGCRNVMLYLDDVPHAEVGVELLKACPLTGQVVASSLPAGTVAMTVHRGSYDGLGEAHGAVIRWCQEHGRERADHDGRSTGRTTTTPPRSGPRCTTCSRSASHRERDQDLVANR